MNLQNQNNAHNVPGKETKQKGKGAKAEERIPLFRNNKLLSAD